MGRNANDTGELTYMNLVHLARCDGTTRQSQPVEIEGRKQAMLAIEACAATPPAVMRSDSATSDDHRIADTRKIDAVYNLPRQMFARRSVSEQHRIYPSSSTVRRCWCCRRRALPAGIRVPSMLATRASGT